VRVLDLLADHEDRGRELASLLRSDPVDLV
jgi:hypothetical protein